MSASANIYADKRDDRVPGDGESSVSRESSLSNRELMKSESRLRAIEVLTALLSGLLPVLLIFGSTWLTRIGFSQISAVKFAPQEIQGAVIIGVAILTAALLVGYFVVANTASATRQALLSLQADIRANSDEYARASAQAREILSSLSAPRVPDAQFKRLG